MKETIVKIILDSLSQHPPIYCSSRFFQLRKWHPYCPVAQIRNVTVILKTALFFLFESVIRLHIFKIFCKYFPSPGDLPDPGVKPGSPALQVDSLLYEPPGKPSISGSQQLLFVFTTQVLIYVTIFLTWKTMIVSPDSFILPLQSTQQVIMEKYFLHCATALLKTHRWLLFVSSSSPCTFLPSQDFPGGTVIKTVLPMQEAQAPGWGSKIPHAE